MSNEEYHMANAMMQIELQGKCCQLKHSKQDPAERHEAVDYLCQNIGAQDRNIVEFEVRIPICQECTDALNGDEWVLLYCIECCSSQWVLKSKAKREYFNKILWLSECPKCSEKGTIQ